MGTYSIAAQTVPQPLLGILSPDPMFIYEYKKSRQINALRAFGGFILFMHKMGFLRASSP